MAEYMLNLNERTNTYLSIPHEASAVLGDFSVTFKLTMGTDYIEPNALDHPQFFQTWTWLDMVARTDRMISNTLATATPSTFNPTAGVIADVNGTGVGGFGSNPIDFNPFVGKIVTMNVEDPSDVGNGYQIGPLTGDGINDGGDGGANIVQIEMICANGNDRLYLLNEVAGATAVNDNNPGVNDATIVNLQGDTHRIFEGLPDVAGIRGVLGTNGSPLPFLTDLQYQVKDAWDDTVVLIEGTGLTTGAAGNYFIDTVPDAVPVPANYYVQFHNTVSGEFALDEAAVGSLIPA